MTRFVYVCWMVMMLAPVGLWAAEADPLAPPAPPAEPSAAEMAALKPHLEALRTYYREAGDFSVSFSQAFHSKLSKHVQTSDGTVDFQKPRNMRWRYQRPEEKAFIAGAGTLWYVEYEAKTVKVRHNLKDSELENSLAFLWGGGTLQKDFVVRQSKVASIEGLVPTNGRITLDLTPRRATSFARLYLLLNAATHRIEEVAMVDSLGNVNHLVFGPPKNNQRFPKSTFGFTPPDKSWTVESLDE